MCEETESLTLEDLFNSKDINSCSSCYVKDVFGDKVQIIFILESPEKEEVRQKVPAVGSSGKAMSKHLLKLTGKENGIGMLIKNNYKNATYFGVINVANYPLQCRIIADYIRTSVKSENNLRKYLAQKVNIKKEGIEVDKCADLLSDMTTDFNRRIDNIILSNKDVIIIPCGDFARAFFEYYLVQSSLTTKQKLAIYRKWANKIPHPSHNNWNKVIYKFSIAKMLRNIKKEIKK